MWEGSRLLQELRQDKMYTYVYTEQNSYEPLAQIETFRQPEKLNTPIIRYFHTDQIGIPREMTDEEGNIVWRGQYSAWGKLTAEEKTNPSIHQPFRLQNQYADEETGLHYNFFRYYDAHCGRFTQQDPIGLAGGDNLYMFAPNVLGWVDYLGLFGTSYLSYKAKLNADKNHLSCLQVLKNRYKNRPQPDITKTKLWICSTYRKHNGNLALAEDELFSLRQTNDPIYTRDDNLAAAERFYEFYNGGYHTDKSLWVGRTFLVGDNVLKWYRNTFKCGRGNASMYGTYVNGWGNKAVDFRQYGITIEEFCK